MHFCDFPPEGDPRVCRLCGRSIRGIPHGPIFSPCAVAGPGSEIKELLAEFGGTLQACPLCTWRARQMDAWGIDGCREHQEEIIGWLRESYGRLSVTQKAGLAARALVKGIAFKIDPTDPPRSLFEMAMERAEGKQSDNVPESV